MKPQIKCLICPKGCELDAGETGDCRVRQNIDGIIRCTTYAKPCALSVDPVEKKPLYHFLPASRIFSMATPGCNLHCKQCQNWQISQTGITRETGSEVLPESIVRMAVREGCPSIAYTYTEPLVSYEYTYDCCKAASEKGIKNVLVTAAYINPDPLRNICRYIDAANVDLKSYSAAFYREICGGELKPVLKALEIMKECGVLLEITNLIIPTLNDRMSEIRKMCTWIVEYLGDDTPLHFSRFFPQNKLEHLPPTPETVIRRARETAIETGLKYVYVGNMPDGAGEHTWCPGCHRILIERRGYHVVRNLIDNNHCPECLTAIHGIWNEPD